MKNEPLFQTLEKERNVPGDNIRFFGGWIESETGATLPHTQFTVGDLAAILL